MELVVDKNNYILSKRYANALVELALKGGLIDVFYNDLIKSLEVYKNNPSFKEIVNLPTIEKNKKKEILNEVLKDDINKTVLNFLYVLIDSSRFDLLETIIYCFKEAKDKANNIINGNLVSSIELNEDMKNKIQEKLERKTNKKVNIEYSIDENLIGGFILTLGEKVVDLSLKNKIKQIKKQLT